MISSIVVPRARLMLYGGLAVFALVIVIASFLYEAQVERWRVQLYAPRPTLPEPEFAELHPIVLDTFATGELRFEAHEWIRSVWRACNTAELESDPQWVPPPATPHGQMYMAGCQALAGRSDVSREIIDDIDEYWRLEAAGTVATTLFPAARQGRYELAGPGMELVLEHWPHMHSATFYAGMGRLAIGDYPAAREHFARFVETAAPGSVSEAMRSKARELLARIEESPAHDSTNATSPQDR
jgi:hypothetical protein